MTAKNSLLLIVDDMPVNLAMLGDLLRAAGYRVKAPSLGIWHFAMPHRSLVPISSFWM